MKKSTALLLSVLAIMSSVFSTACDNKTEESGMLIHGFNSYEAACDYTYEEWFGRAEINTDKAYVTEGEGSLKVYPMADFDKPTEYPYIGVNAMGKDVETRDFSAFEKISLDVYNPNEVAVEVGICLQVNAVELVSTRLQSYKIPPKTWITIYYSLKNGAAKYAFNELKDVASVMIAFKDKRTSLTDEYKPVYVDNLRGYIGETSKTSVEVNEKGVFLDFENSMETDLFDYLFTTKYSCYMADGAVNMDKRFVSSGDKSFQVTLRPDFLDYRDYVGVKLYEPLLSPIVAGKKTLTFDVFNACATDQTLNIEWKIGNVTSKSGDKGNNIPACTVPANGWTTYMIQADNLNALKKLIIEFPTEFTQSNVGQNKVFYLDNFKVE